MKNKFTLATFKAEKVFTIISLQIKHHHMDSEIVVWCLTGYVVGSVQAWSLVHQIKTLIGLNWTVNIQHV